MKQLMVTMAMFLAATALAGEAELKAKLPEIFAKSVEHYVALDAAAKPLVTTGKDGQPTFPHGWNKWRTGKDEYDMRSVLWWTSGHTPGTMWYLYEATGDKRLLEPATRWTEMLEANKTADTNHDLGFITYCSYGNARRLLKTDKYDAILKETATTLSTRYNDGLGLIRSWGKKTETANFLVIPDNMMNLELLEAVSKFAGVSRFDQIARSHAKVTMKHHFRPDGGAYHVLNYCQKDGRVQEIRRGQGASCYTAWSRGQSWAIYGYTMMYRETKDSEFLAFAQKLADYAIFHENMPSDGIPYWDFGAPGEERDSSAGAVMASGLIELSTFVPADKAKLYRAFAVKQLEALASPAYYSEGNEIGHFLLKHGVGAKPGNSEVDTPLNYGDYYFIEGLLRFRALAGK